MKSTIIASVVGTSLARDGQMTITGDIIGASCEYANSQDGGISSPAATSPHVTSGRYCGVDGAKFNNGNGCGACYNVCYSGVGGTNPGRAGCAVVQAVNMAGVDFACNANVFDTITGANTGIFPVTYDEVACDVASPKGVATVLDGNNAYFTKAIFSDLKYAVAAATLTVGPHSFPMQHVGGATWQAGLDGTTGAASFELTLTDGSITGTGSCFNSWPVPTDSSCAPAADSDTVALHSSDVECSDQATCDCSCVGREDTTRVLGGDDNCEPYCWPRCGCKMNKWNDHRLMTCCPALV